MCKKKPGLIRVNSQPIICNLGQNPKAPTQFNNMKYNIPLMNGVQFSILGFLVFGFGLVFHFIHILLIPNMKDGLRYEQ